MNYNPYVCIQTNSRCYKEEGSMVIRGVMWHSTGASNTWISRYVQPSEGADNYEEALEKIGKNIYGNDWNHAQVDSEVNAFIGMFDDGTIGTVQTLPWDHKPWGCFHGSAGSCNNGWIQFEICEDDLKDKEYANKVFEEGCRLTAFLCRKFGLNPNGYAILEGVRVPVITCHNDAAKLGLAGNHADINHWFPKLLGKDMNDVRKRVTEMLKENKETYDEYVSKLPGRGYFLKGDGYKSNIDMKEQIKHIQRFLSWALGVSISISGKYGDTTENAVKSFQKAAGIAVDGSWGEETLAASRSFLK